MSVSCLGVAAKPMHAGVKRPGDVSLLCALRSVAVIQLAQCWDLAEGLCLQADLDVLNIQANIPIRLGIDPDALRGFSRLTTVCRTSSGPGSGAAPAP